MKTTTIWEDNVTHSVNDVALHPHGTIIIAAVGSRVLLYNAKSGSVIHSLQGHRGNVYSVSFSRDGARFASGGADKSVIIWNTDQGKGLIRYTHSDSVQVVAFCPVGGSDNEYMVASCTNSDFGFWSSNRKDTIKYQIEAKIMSAVWTDDGQSIALGLYSGCVSIRDRYGIELIKFDRNSPICVLRWIKSQLSSRMFGNSTEDVLMVGCWDKSISFYHRSGIPHEYGEQSLYFFPLSIASLGFNSELLIVSGSTQDVVVISSRGKILHNHQFGTEKWIWSIESSNVDNIIVSGSNEGRVAMSKVEFDIIECKWEHIYAYRCADLTSICVHDFSDDFDFIVPCNAVVQSLSLNKIALLALLANSEVSVFNIIKIDGSISYELVRSISIYESNTFIAALPSSVIITALSSLSVINLKGEKINEICFDNRRINAVKPVHNNGGEDIVLIALDDGTLMKYAVSNLHTDVSSVLKHMHDIRLIHINIRKDIIAIIDENDTLSVFGGNDFGILQFKRDSVTCFIFNEEVADMSCFCDTRSLCVLFHQQIIYALDLSKVKLPPIRFTRSFVYFHDHTKAYSIRISFSVSVRMLTNKKQLRFAYELGILGIPKADWYMLGLGAMGDFELEIARKAFEMCRDSRYISLIDDMQSQLNKCKKQEEIERTKNLFLGEVAVINKDFDYAVELYGMGEYHDKVIDLYVTLERWDDAMKYAKITKIIDEKALLIRKAKWIAENRNDWMMASKLYFSCGCYVDAVKVVSKSHDDNANLITDAMIDIARSLPKTEKNALKECIRYLEKKEENELIKEILMKLGSAPEIMKHCIRTSDWNTASDLFREKYSDLDQSSVKSYAEGLVLQDKFEEAIDVYRKGTMTEQSIELLKVLADNSVIEERFKDASYLFWLIFLERSKSVQSYCTSHAKEVDQVLVSAKVYYAYQIIHDYCIQPFTSSNADVIFHTAYYIASMIDQGEGLHGVSLVNVCYALAKQAKNNRAFKTARTIYSHIQNLRIPKKLRSIIAMDTLKIQTTSNEDDPELTTVCFRCGASYCLFLIFSKSWKREMCSSCGHPFTRCFLSFDVLPLVEFSVDPALSDDEAIRLIQESPLESSTSNNLFDETINIYLENQMNANAYELMVVNAETLANLNRGEIFVCKPLQAWEKTKFYKNMIPEISIAMSPACNLFFHEEEFEFQFLKEQRCPFTRNKIDNYSHL